MKTLQLHIICLSVLVLLGGCAAMPNYQYQSPTVETVRASGGAENHRRENSGARYEPYTTLAGAVKEAAPVQITVTFSYSSSHSATAPRLGNCSLHIKPADSSIADVKRCKIEKAGNSFLVSFRTKEGEKSFDLHALGGRYDGGRPMSYNGSFVSIGLSSARKQNLRYIYLGPDPFGDIK